MAGEVRCTEHDLVSQHVPLSELAVWKSEWLPTLTSSLNMHLPGVYSKSRVL